MAKVITLSRTFLKGHPKAGHDTFFVEMALNSIMPKKINGCIEIDDILESIKPLVNDFVIIDGAHKHHTIRGGKRWKTGDKASLRVWSGKPYNSPQIAIAPDVELVVKDIEIIVSDGTGDYDRGVWVKIDDIVIAEKIVWALSKNDGLEIDDFYSWFNVSFSGQILIWNNQNLPY